MGSILNFQNQYGISIVLRLLNSPCIKKLMIIHCIKAHTYRTATYLLVFIYGLINLYTSNMGITFHALDSNTMFVTQLHFGSIIANTYVYLNHIEILIYCLTLMYILILYASDNDHDMHVNNN